MRARGPGSALAPGLTVVRHLRRGTDLDVYDAWDEARGTRVVAKTVRPGAPDPRAGRRLLQEGRLLRRLAHPHLVRAFDVHTQPRPLVTLETLPGQTLGVLFAEHRLQPEEAAVLGQQVASALAYLHAHDLLHLDVKPSNVIARDGAAVLLDLSIARRPGRVRAGYGTWCNLAPEQARGGLVTPAADVWGLALLLHEGVTGAPAFDDEDDEEEFPQLHRRAPRARSGSAALDDLLAAGLEPRPEDRPSLNEVRAVLEDIGGSPRASTTP